MRDGYEGSCILQVIGLGNSFIAGAGQVKGDATTIGEWKDEAIK